MNKRSLFYALLEGINPMASVTSIGLVCGSPELDRRLLVDSITQLHLLYSILSHAISCSET